MAASVLGQMFDHGGHMDGWGWGWGLLMMVLLVGLIGLTIWAVVRSTQSRGSDPYQRAREILAERLARGEITTDEFQDLSRHMT